MSVCFSPFFSPLCVQGPAISHRSDDDNCLEISGRRGEGSITKMESYFIVAVSHDSALRAIASECEGTSQKGLKEAPKSRALDVHIYNQFHILQINGAGDRCAFVEHMDEMHYTRLESVAFPEIYLAFNR